MSYHLEPTRSIPNTGNKQKRFNDVAEFNLRQCRLSYSDINENGINRIREKRYVLFKKKWTKLRLTYCAVYPVIPLKISRADVENIVDEAIGMWSNVSGLTFDKRECNRDNVISSTDIVVSFETKDHGDDYPFDGPSGVVGHAFFPGTKSQGRVHMDAAENYTRNSKIGLNLLQILTHELGHTLGLRHSENHGAVMAPYYKPYTPNFQLSTDDIKGIQHLYGLPGDSVLDACNVEGFDAACNTQNGSIYIFKGKYYWRFDEHINLDMKTDTPGKILDDWNGLPDNLDSAFYWPKTGHTFFFKDKLFWVYLNNQPISKDYPKNINNLLIDPPLPIESAFYNHIDETITFTKADSYKKFSKLYAQVEGNINDWNLKNVSNIDAAFQLQNFILLLSKADYYG
ncbi:DgyrCDS1738 [Dimorphilus gyrociliatus]|uniref:DgyrCDS1738 n=1 Tax=Dimorphilus gyrociliatus TaxID=2664684 RepID=A0A7I8VA31_9ANNE|nr:DgyrCDS1738 [Dimorphilus gyrociliatus]